MHCSRSAPHAAQGHAAAAVRLRQSAPAPPALVTPAALRIPRLASMTPAVGTAAASAPRRMAVAVAAAAADDSGGGHQRPLSNAERKAKRAEAQRLGRRLCSVNLGQKGLTPAFLEGFRLALAANELVKVRVGACDETREEVAAALTAECDCVLVHSIGFTLTFYREAGLPPPPASRRGPGAAAAPGGEEEGSGWEECDPDEVDELDPELAAHLMENEDAFSDSDSEGEGSDGEAEAGGGRGGSSGRQAAKQGRPPPPPEFTVLS